MDRELLKEISIISGFYEEINIDNHVIPLMFSGMNGLYICTENVTDDALDIKIYTAVKNKLGLNDDQVFLFGIAEDDTGRFYDYRDGFVYMENIYEAYQNCYANHLIPQADLFHIQFDSPSSYCKSVEYEQSCDNYEEDAESYIVPVISEKRLFKLEQKIAALLEEPVQDGQYRVYPDGRMEVKRTVTQSVAGISTFIEKGSAYYPCMDADGDKFFLLTFLGGWFGFHKFKTGNYLKGLFYALTCGCCGVFYILDLLSILLGGYNYSMITCDKSGGTVEFQKKKFYSRPLQNKMRAVLLLVAAIAVAFLLINFIYIPVLENVNVFLANILSETQFADKLANTMLTY